MTSLVSLSDLRTHLNWPSTKGTEDDAELLEFGSAATDLCESALGRPIRLVQTTDTYMGGRCTIRLRRVPCACVSCTALRSLTVSTIVENSNTLTSNDYAVDYVNGVLYRGRPSVLSWFQLGLAPSVAVTYTAGYTTPPSWATMAVKRMVEHLWKQSQPPRGRPSSINEGAPAAGAAFLTPYMVQSLLDPHGHGGVLVA